LVTAWTDESDVLEILASPVNHTKASIDRACRALEVINEYLNRVQIDGRVELNPLVV
jgi:hypothetical protein